MYRERGYIISEYVQGKRVYNLGCCTMEETYERVGVLAVVCFLCRATPINKHCVNVISILSPQLGTNSFVLNTNTFVFTIQQRQTLYTLSVSISQSNTFQGSYRSSVVTFPHFSSHGMTISPTLSKQ